MLGAGIWFLCQFGGLAAQAKVSQGEAVPRAGSGLLDLALAGSDFDGPTALGSRLDEPSPARSVGRDRKGDTMASFNKVILVGNVTRDVDLRYTPGGLAVTDLGLAVNDRVKRNNEWVDETTFVDVTLWGKTAEVAGQYVTKGAPVLIEGRLKLDSWEQDGQKRSKLKVVAERLQMLGGRQGGGGGGPSGSGGRSERAPAARGRGGDQAGGYAEYDYGDASGPMGDDDPPF